MWIYLVHWEVYPHLEADNRLLAALSGIAAGIVVQQLVSAGGRLARTALLRGNRPVAHTV